MTHSWAWAIVLPAMVACGSSTSPSSTNNGNGNNGNGNNGNGNSGDSITVTLVLHGLTQTENLTEVGYVVGSSTINRANLSPGQATIIENEQQDGKDETLPFNVAKGQSVSLFAIEGAPSWFDNTSTYYTPTVADTAVPGSASEFVSWSSPCGNASFGDCQLTNVQSNVTVTANFQRMKSLNVQVLGVGNFIRTIQTRAPLTIPVTASNQLNGTTDTIPGGGGFFDSASAYAYEVALFSGSQITIKAINALAAGATVHFDEWDGGCLEAGGPTCLIQWPTAAGGDFTFPENHSPSTPTASFQWYKCTQNGQPMAAQASDITNSGAGVSCTLESP